MSIAVFQHYSTYRDRWWTEPLPQSIPHLVCCVNIAGRGLRKVQLSTPNGGLRARCSSFLFWHHSPPASPLQGFCLSWLRRSRAGGSFSKRSRTDGSSLNKPYHTCVQSWQFWECRAIEASCLSFTSESLSLEYDKSSTQSPMKLSMYLHILFCGSVRMKKIWEWKNTVVVHQGRLILS